MRAYRTKGSEKKRQKGRENERTSEGTRNRERKRERANEGKRERDKAKESIRGKESPVYGVTYAHIEPS